MGKSKKSFLPSLNPSDARQLSLSVWEKAVMKKALNAILFIAAAWALNTGTHSFEKAEGGGTVAKWIHLCEPVNTNSSKKRRKFAETTRNRLVSEINSSFLTLLVNNFVKAVCYKSCLGAGGGAQLGFLRQHVWLVTKPSFEMSTTK